MYKVNGIYTVFWKVSKTHYPDDVDMYKALLTELSEYTGVDYFKIPLQQVSRLAWNALAEYMAKGLCKEHLINSMHSIISGDMIKEAVFGIDTRSTDERIISAVLTVFMLSEVFHKEETVRYIPLVDYGQVQPKDEVFKY